MITAYARGIDRVEVHELTIESLLPENTVWIDLFRPSNAEREHISALIGFELPSKAEMEEIQMSARLYSEAGAYVLTALAVAHGDANVPELGPLTSVLLPTVLVTQRFIDPRTVPLLVARMARQPGCAVSPHEVLLAFLETVVDRAADLVEIAGDKLDKLSQAIFDEAHLSPIPGARSRSSQDEDVQKQVLRDLGQTAERIGKLRDSLASYERLTTYFQTVAGSLFGKDGKSRIKSVARDLGSLSSHANFMTDRLTFLLDAMVGLINIQQNNIVRIFSVAAVAFLPPTLVASIYGMNFEFMPELKWKLGYPLAVFLMILSAILPLAYFRRKGWL